MVKWTCDMCGKETRVNPPCEQTGELIDFEYMDPFTNEITSKKVNKVKDLLPRTHIVKLNAGQQIIQRDFCGECVDTIPEIKALWDVLKAIKPK